MERDPASSRPETAARADPAASGDSVRSNPGHHRVVVVGGGFGGLEVVRHLRREKTVSVTLVDRRNFHLFQPLLYQVATGGLSPANIAAPYRAIFSRQKNCDIVLGEVVDFDPERRRVILRDGELEYDTLVVAAGSRHGYFGHDEWEEIAPGLKTLEDALEIRRRIYSAFETADRSDDEAERHAFLTFVIVGAGPTGVELAGTLAEIARHTLRHDFRHIDPGIARIYLLDAGPKVLGAYPDELSDSARASLERLGVTVRTGTTVRSIEPGRVHVTSPTDGDETIEARTIIWAAGVKASALAQKLAEATGAEVDRAGRVVVENDLSVGRYRDIFAIGDMALVRTERGEPLPGTAPVAIEQGRYVARVIRNRMRGRPAPTYRPKIPGMIATIGRAAAVGEIGRFRIRGWIAWLLWLFVHLMKLTLFTNRLLVLIQWGWSYFTHSRSARLVTGLEHGPGGETASVAREAGVRTIGPRS